MDSGFEWAKGVTGKDSVFLDFLGVKEISERPCSWNIRLISAVIHQSHAFLNICIVVPVFEVKDILQISPYSWRGRTDGSNASSDSRTCHGREVEPFLHGSGGVKYPFALKKSFSCGLNCISNTRSLHLSCWLGDISSVISAESLFYKTHKRREDYSLSFRISSSQKFDQGETIKSLCRRSHLKPFKKRPQGLS